MELTVASSEVSPAATRRRRRWLMVAFVLVLVIGSLYSWWYWPRGDARFVGKWAVFDSDSSTQSFAIADFQASGIVEYRYRDTDDILVQIWTVTDNHMVYGSDDNRWWSGAVAFATDKLNSVLSTKYMWFVRAVMPIKAIDQDEFRLGPPLYELGLAESPDKLYRRIPE